MCAIRNGLVASLVALCMSFGSIASASDVFPPREPSPLTVRQIHSGHSLTDEYGAHPWPGRFTLATELHTGNRAHDTILRSIIPGSPLFWRWDHSTGTPDARHDIGKFELLVTTEGVPLTPNPDHFRDDTLVPLERWVRHAGTEGNGGRGAELMLYATWTHWRHSEGVPDDHPEHALPFRERMELQGARWEAMQDHANAVRPEGMPLIYMIPGHRLMLQLHDDIAAGVAPGLSSIGDVFSDDIHLNAAGRYMITMLVYAVIYHRNPEALPNRLARQEDKFSPELAKYFKTLAWNVATSYPRSGVPAP